MEKEDHPKVNQVTVEEASRPKIGIGICWYNEDGQIICGKRIGSKIGSYQFPGGYLEFGETFEECASRELQEEVGIHVPPESIKYVTTINVRRTDHNYHNVGIIMSTKIKKDIKMINSEPEKNEGWQWMLWEDFINQEDLFYPVHVIVQQGITKIEQFH